MSDYEQRFPGADVRRVEIDRHDGDVMLRWSARDDVLVSGEQAVEVEVDGDTLTISGDTERGLRGLFGGASLRVELPETVQETRIRVRNGDVEIEQARGGVDARMDHGDLKVKGGHGELAVKLGAGDAKVEDYSGPIALTSGTGDVSLSGPSGPVAVQTGNGDVTLRGGDGDVAIHSGRGDIELRDRSCAHAEVKTGAGDVVISGGTSGSTSIQTGMGDINCATSLGTQEHEFTTAAGDIRVAIPRGLAARIDATTVSGSIDSDIPLVAVGKRGPRSMLGRRLVGGIGEGPQRAEIRIRSVRGDVRVTWLDGAGVAPSAPRTTWSSVDDVDVDDDVDTDTGTGMNVDMGAIPMPPSMPEAPQQPGPADEPAPPSELASEERAILSALAAGTITVAEAERLLDALERRGAEPGTH